MTAYWTRILGAWLLLKLASAVVKDAEHLLAESADKRKYSVPAREQTIIDTTATEVTA